MQLTYNNNKLKIDNGDHYYIGIINKELFPPIIADNYEDIITKSFDNFSDDTTSIQHIIIEEKFIINFKFNCKPLNISETIEIMITRHEKDFRDYTNERIEKLENDNKELKIKLAELATILLKTESVKDEESDEDDEEEESDEEPPDTKFVSSKIKGTVSVHQKPVAQKTVKGKKNITNS